MAELRGGRDEPDGGDLPARHYPADSGDGDGDGEVRPRAEPSPRAEYAEVARQNSERAGQDQEDADQATEPSNTHVLERFEPRRAGLPEVSRADAATYIEEHQSDRPWLATARDCPPEAQRVFVALDQGRGHGHIRHEGWVTEEMNERRVRYLEDPAQLGLDKREAGVDAFKVGNQSHRCGGIVSRITHPEAFATAFARGVEHPEVRAALDSPVLVPRPVSLPISDVLGDDGHRFCSGWQLEPVNGSLLEAVANRAAWLAGNNDVPEPRVRPVETFEGGTVTYVFRPGVDGGHEVSTMYVNPPDEQLT